MSLLKELSPWEKEREERINLGIAIAHATTMPRQRRTLAEIGLYADCSKETIRKIEFEALKKVRHRLQAILDYEEVEL